MPSIEGINKLKTDNEQLQSLVVDLTNACKKYKNILQEIKKIAEMDCGNCPYNQDCDCNFQECEEAKIDDILRKISEVME